MSYLNPSRLKLGSDQYLPSHATLIQKIRRDDRRVDDHGANSDGADPADQEAPAQEPFLRFEADGFTRR